MTAKLQVVSLWIINASLTVSMAFFQNCAPAEYDIRGGGALGVASQGNNTGGGNTPGGSNNNGGNPGGGNNTGGGTPGGGTPGGGTPGSEPEIGYPSIGRIATATFEDQFPNPGDADYNDLIVNFKITEHVNVKGELEKIEIDFLPRARSAGYDHRFLLVMDGKKDTPSNLSRQTKPLFNGDARIRLRLFDQDGKVTTDADNLPKNKDLVIFNRTKPLFVDAKGQPVNEANSRAGEKLLVPRRTARLEIELQDPSLNKLTSNKIDIRRYRMVLHVHDTQKDIDLIDVDPLSFDSKGMPFGFIVPTDWNYPLMRVNIEAVYPDFKAYRAYLLNSLMDPDLVPTGAAKDWFLRPAPNAGGQIFDEDLFDAD